MALSHPGSERRQDNSVTYAAARGIRLTPARVAGDLLLRFEGRILKIDVAVMLAWGALAAEPENKGRTMPAIGSLISAPAPHHDLMLATRNEDDLRHTGVRILNP